MNGPQVVDDFIRFGIAPICTAVVALLVARFTRSHADRTDRRRNAQETLKDFVRALQRYDDAFDRHVLHKKDQLYRPHLLTEFHKDRSRETLEEMQRQIATLDEYRAILQLIGLPQSSQNLWKYLEVNGQVRKLLKQQPSPSEAKIDVAIEPLRTAKEALIRSLSTRYLKL